MKFQKSCWSLLPLNMKRAMTGYQNRTGHPDVVTVQRQQL